jgi:hypothetical protein
MLVHMSSRVDVVVIILTKASARLLGVSKAKKMCYVCANDRNSVTCDPCSMLVVLRVFAYSLLMPNPFLIMLLISPFSLIPCRPHIECSRPTPSCGSLR